MKQNKRAVPFSVFCLCVGMILSLNMLSGCASRENVSNHNGTLDDNAGIQEQLREEKDTEAPKVSVQEVRLFAEEERVLLPEQFICEIQDESECTVEFVTQPDLSTYGKQFVKLNVMDTAGNSTEVESAFLLINAKENLLLELGSVLPQAEEFLFESGSEISFLTEFDEISVMSEGIHEITLLVDGIEVRSTLQIADTTAPILQLKPVETWMNKPLDAALLVDYENSSDNSDAFDISYVTEPDWTLCGEQEATVLATDSAGNMTSQVTTLLIKKDEKAPVVTVTDIDVKVGGTVSYKKAVSYYDDIDSKEEMKLSIERDGVNLKEVGTYEVTYIVTDCSGNSTSVVGKINVLSEEPKWADEDAIHEKAKSILDSILEEGMTDREKAKAIYRWIKWNVGYNGHSEKGNYMRGAYEGLFKYTGDCFVYAATAKELLTMAEIPNIDIVKSRINPSHYWNLVYIDGGWYHFDSTPRKDKSEFFLLTDAELEAYSTANGDTHIFDRSLYPEIQ